jgi:hypothetical protein
VRYRGVAAEAVVDVRVLLQRPVGSVVGHRYLRRHGSPNRMGPQTKAPALKPSRLGQSQYGCG